LKETVNNNKDITDLNAFVFLSSFTTDAEKSAAQPLAMKLYDFLGSQELQKNNRNSRRGRTAKHLEFVS